MERLIVIIKTIETEKERLVSFIGKKTEINILNVTQAFPEMKDLHKYVVTVFTYNDDFHKKRRDSEIIKQYLHSKESLGKVGIYNGKYSLGISMEEDYD